MTPEAFRAHLRALDLTIGDFAHLTGVHPITARSWGKLRHGREVQAFPVWVPLLLEAWQKTGVTL